MVDQKIIWKVDGMDCTNCAQGIQRYLERKGMQSVFVDFATGDVQFEKVSDTLTEEELRKGISKMGYTIVEESTPPPFWTLERKLLVSALFTLPLFLDHIIMMLSGAGFPFLHGAPWLQLLVCLPVFAIGVWHFGASAWGSLKSGVPNMDVLIFMGSTAAFIYSLIGTIIGNPQYIFYETAATIITLVLVGNWIEKRSVQKTTSAIDELSSLEVQEARKLMPSGTVVTLPIDEVRKGDLLLVNSGDAVPTDSMLVEGQALVDESLLTGESIPVNKLPGDSLIGASVL
ncbi:MAG: cation-translocating P-type ATPase, partial [Phaeodactylibacter sp.]|nr:cation-translocating P-type ATPase [Phaeodactylibacter sp.]